VVANALSRGYSANAVHSSIAGNTSGVVFFGTPFEGSDAAIIGGMGLRLLQMLGVSHNKKLGELKRGSKRLMTTADNFYSYLKARDRSRKPLEVACFYEQHETCAGGARIGVVVDKSSACLKGMDPIPASDDHRGMCRFSDRDQKGYQDVIGLLRRWTEPSIGELDEKPCMPRGPENQIRVSHLRPLILANALRLHNILPDTN